MKQPEYTEGPEALENFERLAMAALRTPRPTSGTKKKKQVKPARNLWTVIAPLDDEAKASDR